MLISLMNCQILPMYVPSHPIDSAKSSSPNVVSSVGVLYFLIFSSRLTCISAHTWSIPFSLRCLMNVRRRAVEMSSHHEFHPTPIVLDHLSGFGMLLCILIFFAASFHTIHSIDVMAPFPSSEGTMPYLIFISRSMSHMILASFGSHLPTMLGAF